MSQPAGSCLLSLGTPLTNHRHNTISPVQPATAPQLLLFLPSQTSSVKRHKTRVSGPHCQNKLLIGIAPLFILARQGHVLSIKINVTPLCFAQIFYFVWQRRNVLPFFPQAVNSRTTHTTSHVIHITIWALLKYSNLIDQGMKSKQTGTSLMPVFLMNELELKVHSLIGHISSAAIV